MVVDNLMSRHHRGVSVELTRVMAVGQGHVIRADLRAVAFVDDPAYREALTQEDPRRYRS